MHKFDRNLKRKKKRQKYFHPFYSINLLNVIPTFSHAILLFRSPDIAKKFTINARRPNCRLFGKPLTAWHYGMDECLQTDNRVSVKV